MNRTIVLQCIRKHLELCEAPAGPRLVLGEIVPIIAQELRSDGAQASSSTSIISVVSLAAFVDGEITSEEEFRICQAVRNDNSVLAELIAAVRAQSEWEHLGPVDDDLTEKLSALVPNSVAFTQPATTASPSVSASLPAPQPSSIPSAIAWQTSKPWNWQNPIVMTLAASLLIVLGLTWSWYSAKSPPVAESETPSTKDLVEQPTEQDHRELRPVPDSIDLPNSDSPESFALSPEKSTSPSEDRPELGMEDKESTSPVVIDQSKLAVDRPNPDDDGTSQNESPRTTTSESSNLERRDRSIRWSKIQGLLAHRAGLRQEQKSNDRRPWAGVESGKSFWTDREDESEIEVRTFPFSRAEAAMQSGRIVFASDTSLRWNRDRLKRIDQIDLDQGAFALIDQSEGTELAIRSSGTPVASLTWDSPATVVVESTIHGLQLLIDEGTVKINGTPQKNVLLTLNPEQPMQSQAKPRRLPAWVARPIESVQISRSILAQLSKSRDIDSTLDSLLEDSQNRPDAESDPKWAWMLQWRASLKEDFLFEQLGHSRPMVRLLAFQRMLQLPDWDPRWIKFWQSLEQQASTANRLQTLRDAATMARSGFQLNPRQANQLLSVLESPNPSERVLADLFLRRFLGNGPNFDPTIEGDARGTGLWRRFINASFGR